ncbi:MAG: ABC transporter ATP-binding protein [Clostridia bacterium]|nr:ABC transporter ATP-binding protein [Clostridia bacterium]
MQQEEKRKKLTGNQSMKALKRLLPYFSPYKKSLFFDLFCAAMTTVCELVLPMIVRRITNAATGESGEVLTPGLILGVGCVYIFLRFVDALASYYMNSYGHIMGTRIETDLRRDLFSHLQKLSFSYYNNAKIGVLMSRITNDLFDITEFAHHCPEEFFIAGVKIIGSFAILCTVNIPLTLIIFAMLPGMAFCMFRFNRKLKDGHKESRRKVGELNATIEDSLLGIHVVKSFAGEEKEITKFAEGNKGFFKIKSYVYKLMGTFHCISRLFDGLMYIMTVIIGSFFIMNESINAADLMAYLLYVTTLFASIRTILQFSEQFYRGITGIERFGEIMDTEPDITDIPEAKSLGRAEGDIVFDNVTFRYDGTETDVLKSFDLFVKKGENLAVVGPSGAGKTTLCSLIPRFYEPTEGKILIDGTDIREYTQKSLRQNIGIVEQDVYLFSGSVRENIAYGKPDSTDEEIENAARLADAYDFITSLPDGFDTYVGERGVKLSGGQKQRISIARVFLKNPPILILDEATSALDNESERLVRDSLSRLAKGRTTITIAHRLTTIKNADRIIVLTEDGIAEEGSHQELLKKDGLYSELYKLYTTEE